MNKLLLTKLVLSCCIAVSFGFACVVANAMASCAQGDYYVPALGGYVLLPKRYVVEDIALEPGIDRVYRSPAAPLLQSCHTSELAVLAGAITIGTPEAVATYGKLPPSAPVIVTTVGELSVTVWRISLQGEVNQRTKALISNRKHALVVFDSDPDLWKRIAESYQRM